MEELKTPPQNVTLTIEVIKGGFVLHYPLKVEGHEWSFIQRELFTSARKMNQRLKEVLEETSTTPVDSE